ncbi:MAG TPA: DUF4112 domain-containing protein [Burkholderiales bacterium]|nr:DUF4112 domain-containing protein [Burkholderiales bacterium]
MARIIDVGDAGRVESVRSAEGEQTLETVKRLAWLLDSSLPIPGTRLTVGLDALIGLFPFLGDLIGVLLSSYIVSQAAKLGAPRSVLWRMSFNVAIEGVIGIIPFAGDLFDAAFKANQRNVRLLADWLDQPKKTERATRAFGAVLMLAVIVLFALLGTGSFFFWRWILGV